MEQCKARIKIGWMSYLENDVKRKHKEDRCDAAGNDVMGNKGNFELCEL